MSNKLPILLAAALVLSAPRAQAVIGTPDVVPAATLLLPYFEVDLDDPAGPNTIITYRNDSATAILTHVTLWTDLGVPTFAFNIYLTGFDAATLDLRMLFVGGAVTPSASAGQDPGDALDPKGQFSQDINFASCTGQLPPPPVPANYLTHLRAAHTGQGSTFFAGKCSGISHGDHLARGFVTIDTVNNCTLRLPGDVGYFAPGGTGDVTNQNNMTGRYTYVNRKAKVAFANPMVHIEASSSDSLTKTSGNYTFYGALVGWTASDNREPLPTTFQTRFVNGDDPSGVMSDFSSGKTSFFVWRDPQVKMTAFACGTTPSPFPLGQRQGLVVDQQDNMTAISASATPFGFASQHVTIGDLGATSALGHVMLNLNSASGSNGPPANPLARQAFVSAIHTANKDAASIDAQPLDNAASALIRVTPLDPRACLNQSAATDQCINPQAQAHMDFGFCSNAPCGQLLTSQGGATDSFTVVLARQPSASVTVPIASSSTTAGVVNQSSLTFTTSNWNVPQKVTITGHNSGAGAAVGYSITVGAASSSDSSFNGQSGLSVLVFNVPAT